MYRQIERKGGQAADGIVSINGHAPGTASATRWSTEIQKPRLWRRRDDGSMPGQRLWRCPGIEPAPRCPICWSPSRTPNLTNHLTPAALCHRLTDANAILSSRRCSPRKLAPCSRRRCPSFTRQSRFTRNLLAPAVTVGERRELWILPPFFFGLFFCL